SVHGGGGGDLNTVSWPADEYLVRVWGTYGATYRISLLDKISPSYVGQISFLTNTGRVLGPYGQALGFMNLNRFDFSVPAGNQIAGFTGRASSFLNAIGVIYTPRPTTAPDLAVSLAQPSPALTATALSELPVAVTNQGNQATNTPLTLTMKLPSGIVSPAKFARNAEAWVCLNAANTITCTYKQSLAMGDTTVVRLPITPTAQTLNTAPGPFVANVAVVSGETNTANNTSPALALAATVQALNLTSIADPNYSQPLLHPVTIPKYALPLPNAFAAYFQHTPDTKSIPGTDSYNLDIKQINTHILPPGFPATPVYAYGDPARPDTFSYPAHTIKANSTAAGLNTLGLGKPVKVSFKDTRTGVKHLLPVDSSIHGAMAGEPEIRSIAHLHGIQYINQNSDGYPEAWISPSGKNGGQFNVTSPTVPVNLNPNDYGNNQEATLLWFHDHTLGITRLNVYAGLAGLYLLRDSNEQAMIDANNLPNGAYEIPLVLQDRMFHPDGTLAYPDLNPAVPGSPNPTLMPEFFGNVMVVNGVAWPFLEVEPRRYRFRVLNGSGSRFYNLTLSNNASFEVLGTEGGFLDAPAAVTSLTIAPAERYDIVVDFSAMGGQSINLANSANIPFPGGAAVTPNLDDQIMQFRVNQPLSASPNNPLPGALRATLPPESNPVIATPRQVLLAETTDNNGRILPILGTVANGLLGWMDTVTESPTAETFETWEIFNDTMDSHPIHLHGGHFKILSREPFTATVGINHSLLDIQYPGVAATPAAYEQSWKDTVITYPGEVTRIQVDFESAGLFVWHCHILEHEDHDMMRPMLVQ
ncbi:MAG: multicopper oxidase domain-containing protein, partial [Methylococcaceae bacterium]|nr:multicopper oxidase domain-containing protein [Methylococcaceae bacterium]